MILGKEDKPDLNELAHFGVKGMKWGIRKRRDSSDRDKSTKRQDPKRRFTPEQKAMAKKAAIGVGALLAATGAIIVAHQLNKNGKLPIDSITKASDKGRAETQKILKEPVSLIYASRPKSKGFRFFRTGGIPSYLTEYENAFGADSFENGLFKRYGNNNEKIATSFFDPDGRKDFSGRPIPHQIIIPKSMSTGINSLEDVMDKVWPLLKDQYDAAYDA